MYVLLPWAWKTLRESVQMQSCFCSIFFCIRTECRKMRTRNNPVFGHFSRSEKWVELCAGIKISQRFLSLGFSRQLIMEKQLLIFQDYNHILQTKRLTVYLTVIRNMQYLLCTVGIYLIAGTLSAISFNANKIYANIICANGWQQGICLTINWRDLEVPKLLTKIADIAYKWRYSITMKIFVFSYIIFKLTLLKLKTLKKKGSTRKYTYVLND